ncbi:MAG: translocation/assembly module TamB domain-containing protein [Candidatus Babeliaceae bacterium]
MKWLSFLIKILATFLLGFSALFLYIQNDNWFQKHFEKRVLNFFEQSYKCHFNAQLTGINFFTGTLDLEKADATALHTTDWTWQADHISVTFGWLKFFIQKPIDVTIKIDHLWINSTCTQAQPAIFEHLLLLMKPTKTSLPSQVKKFEVNQIQASIEHTQLPLTSSFILNNFGLYNLSGHTKVLTLIKDASCKLEQKLLFHQMQGTLRMQLPLKLPTGKFAPFHVDLQGIIGNDPADEGNITLTTHNEQGTLKVITKNNHYSIDGSFDNSFVTQLTFALNLAGITSFLNNTLPLAGTIQGSAQIHNNQLTAFDAQLLNAQYNHLPIPPLQVTGSHTGDGLKGLMQITHETQPLLNGTWQYQCAQKEATFKVTNEQTVTYGTLQIPTHAAIIQGVLNKTPYLDLNCTITDELDKSYMVTASCVKQNNQLLFSGHCATFDVQATIALKPLYLDSAYIFENKTQKASFNHKKNNAFMGTIDYSLLRQFLKKIGRDAPGQGTITFKGHTIKEGISAQIALQDASIYIPEISNIINNAQLRIIVDLAQKQITLNDAHISLYKGIIHTKQGILTFNQSNQLSYACLPLVLEDCFIAHHNDIFAFISGGLTAHFTPQKGLLEGNLIIDQAHMRNNMLSTEFSNNLINQNVYYNPVINLTIETRTPLMVKTPFLETTAHCALSAQGTLLHPEITGTIELRKGSLEFPYQPLYITQGKLYFLPQQLNPLIEITARNTIKKYAIDLSIGGSLKNPALHFSSYPHLAQEQIMALLLGGSEDGSLFLSMPQALTDYMEKLLFGPASTSQKTLRKLKHLFKPLKNVRLVPNFTDKTGRGGVRGALAIEVNDRLRGLIQQNFSLSEDTRLEVEYALSDDMTIRAIKDERGDTGGELEMRWKW